MTSITASAFSKLATSNLNVAVVFGSIRGVLVLLNTLMPGGLSTVIDLVAWRCDSGEASSGASITTRFTTLELGAIVCGTKAAKVMVGMGVLAITPLIVQVSVVPPAST